MYIGYAGYVILSFLQFTMAFFNDPIIHYNEPAPRTGHAFVEYKDSIYLVGGRYCDSQPISPSSIDIFDPTTFKWQQCNTIGDVAEEVSYTAYATVGNLLYLFGGYLGKEIIETMRVLDLESLKWSSVKQNNVPSPRYSAKMVIDGVDNLFLYGGIGGIHQTFSDLYIFSIRDGECVRLHYEFQLKVGVTKLTFFIVACLLVRYNIYHSKKRIAVSLLLRIQVSKLIFTSSLL